ncbi:hypothetical protein [Aquabacterium commune]|jgi:hypothetical protein|uniref:hypothetical protein n=1 Tax=Aquabacterium commune TaxID=70586 RepID=UPI0010607EEF|nr:hypothetical protein [Aquabacterium commune]
MLSSIIEFAMLRRAVAKQAAGQQAPQSTHAAPAEVKPAEGKPGFGMDIHEPSPVFGDEMWEHAGHVTTDVF